MILLMSSELLEFEIQINISSIRERFELLSINFKDNIDILLLTKTKMDQNFPDPQFAIDGYSRPFRFDRNQQGGDILVFSREDILPHSLNLQIDNECLTFEMNLRKKRLKKRLLCCSYNPNKILISKHLHEFTQRVINPLSQK